jgi:short-subunit dehydrogenase
MSALAGKTAVVTGASSGIGHAIARRLAAEGVSLALLSRSVTALRALASEVRGQAPFVHWEALDFSDLDAMKRASSSLLAVVPDVDILVHSAGILALGRIEDVPPEQFLEQFKVNALAPYALTRHLLPALRRRQGDIVFINSRAGLVTRPEIVHYCASKHAMKVVADGLRAELHGSGVRVMSVYPGRVATPMQRQVHEARGQEYRPELYMSAEEVAEAVVKALGMPPNFELADMVVRSHGDSPA